MIGRKITELFASLRTQVKLIFGAFVFNGILLTIISLSTWFIDIWALRIYMFLSPQVLTHIICMLLMSTYLCKKACENTSAFISGFLLLVTGLISFLYAIIILINVAVNGCASVPACLNVKEIFIVVMITMIVLGFVEVMLFLYIVIFVNNTIKKSCERKCDNELADYDIINSRAIGVDNDLNVGKKYT